MAELDRLILHAAAKVNLGLAVLRRLPDGYHELLTTFQAIDLFDTLEFEKKSDGGIRICCNNPEFPLGRENLIYRVFQQAEQRCGCRVNLRISVEKRIPIAAGLGGGSANAAAAICAANILYDMKLSDTQLVYWGAELGADVPFFLGNVQAEGRGRGDILTPVQIFADYWLVVIKPPVGLAAAEVYRKFDLALTKPACGLSFSHCRDGNVFFAVIARANNDLEEIVLELCPEAEHAKRFLEGLGSVSAKVSGSGPCVFGIFKEKPDLLEISHLSPSADWQIFICRPLANRKAIGVGKPDQGQTDRQGADRGNH